MDELYSRHYGISRLELNKEFLEKVDPAALILEVGSNVGSQLQTLQAMHFENLYGIELQWYAVELAKQKTRHINLIQGSAFDIPFRSGFFDMVFTSGVLIHISPDDVGRAISEIHRCTRRFIWGFEYFADAWTEIPYRGQEGLMWKTNYARLYLDTFPDLRLVQARQVPYLNGANVDQMFLLEKVT
jgi:pseudaminic acid biosynthesis-associated methylase